MSELICKKCVWRDRVVCPYKREYNFKTSTCGGFKMTANEQKKAERAVQAERLKAMSERGLTPKYAKGQTVWLTRWPNTSEQSEIREVYIYNDCKDFYYKIKHHVTPTKESDLYPTEAECYEHIVTEYIKNTVREANRIKARAVKAGVSIESINQLMLENYATTNSKENL